METKNTGRTGDTDGVQILLIDDDELLREALESILKTVGYSVIHASDGELGLRAFEESRPALVVTDILMPNVEGIQTIRELRRIDGSAKIIAISGGDRGGDVQYLEMASKLGADRILAKPFRRQALLDLIEELLPRR